MSEKILGHLGVERLVLASGGHTKRDDGVCLLEAVAWFAGLPHSDSPPCTDRVLAAFGRRLNDRLSEQDRQLLVPLIPTLVGTAGSPELSRRRMFHLVDSCIRRALPVMCRARGEEVRALELEALTPITTGVAALVARDVLRSYADASAAYAYAYAAYAASAAYAYAYAASAAYAYASAASAASAADADARSKIIAISIESFREAIAMTEAL